MANKSCTESIHMFRHKNKTKKNKKQHNTDSREHYIKNIKTIL